MAKASKTDLGDRKIGQDYIPGTHFASPQSSTHSANTFFTPVASLSQLSPPQLKLSQSNIESSFAGPYQPIQSVRVFLKGKF